MTVDLASLNMSAEIFPADKYTPIALLGESSRAVVILARDKQRGTKVAVKCFKRIGAAHQAGFESEVRKNKQLSHTNIAKITDFGLHSGKVPYLVTEYKEGFDIEQCLAIYGTPSHDVAVKILIGLCETLLYAQKQSVLHRDIRPGNVLFLDDLNSEPSVSLTDFALPKTKITEGVTDPRDVVYMSADEARGLEYNEKSEIYSIGCIGFALLTGRAPFYADSVQELKNLHGLKLPPKISDLAFDSTRPKDLEEVVERCLEKDPGYRFDSVQKLLERLEVFPRREQLRITAVLDARKKKKLLTMVGAGIVAISLCIAGYLVFGPH